MITRKELGERIYGARTQLGLSAGRAAACIDVTAEQFRKYERGESPVEAITLLRIAAIFDLKITDFLE